MEPLRHRVPVQLTNPKAGNGNRAERRAVKAALRKPSARRGADQTVREYIRKTKKSAE